MNAELCWLCSFFLGQKKVALFLEIGWVKFILSFTRLHSWMCIRICTFRFKKHIHKQKAKESREEKRKRKETKEWQQKENAVVTNCICGKFNVIQHHVSLQICSMYFYPSWLSHEFLLVVHINLMYFVCNERSCDICYTITACEVLTFKNEKKKNYSLYFTILT